MQTAYYAVKTLDRRGPDELSATTDEATKLTPPRGGTAGQQILHIVSFLTVCSQLISRERLVRGSSCLGLKLLQQRYRNGLDTRRIESSQSHGAGTNQALGDSLYRL